MSTIFDCRHRKLPRCEKYIHISFENQFSKFVEEFQEAMEAHAIFARKRDLGKATGKDFKNMLLEFFDVSQSAQQVVYNGIQKFRYYKDFQDDLNLADDILLPYSEELGSVLTKFIECFYETVYAYVFFKKCMQEYRTDFYKNSYEYMMDRFINMSCLSQKLIFLATQVYRRYRISLEDVYRLGLKKNKDRGYYG